MLPAMPAPEAELYVAPGCPYCPRVRAALERLLADGAIGALRVVDISREPERARALGIRAVPWLRLGPLELQGLHTEGELREWARAAAGDTRALARYVEQELAAGRLEAMTRHAAAEPARWVPALLALLADEEADLKARIGVSALLEQLAAEGRLSEWIGALGELARSERPGVRADAAHLLGLTGDPAARRWLEPLLADANPDVREIAAEALEALSRDRGAGQAGA